MVISPVLPARATAERLAAQYRSIAAGRLKPHTDQIKAVELLEKRVIRICAEEF